MTDCSQLSALLANALQQRSQLPQNIEQYCTDVAAGNIQLYKQCRQSQGALRQEVDQQIALFSHETGICSALIGTWTWQVVIIDSFGISHTVTQTLNITSWDTQGPWNGTIYSSEVAGMQLTQPLDPRNAPSHSINSSVLSSRSSTTTLPYCAWEKEPSDCSRWICRSGPARRVEPSISN